MRCGGGCGGVRACGVWGAESIRKSPPVFDKEGMVISSGLRCVGGRSPLHPLTPVLSGPDPLHSPCDSEHIHAGQTFYTINFRKGTFSAPPNLFAATRYPSENTCAWVFRVVHFSLTAQYLWLPTGAYNGLSQLFPLTPGTLSPLPTVGPVGAAGGGGAAEAGRGEESRAARAHHGEAGEKSRSPAGRFKLGAA